MLELEPTYLKPREYQQELYKRASAGNIIAVLETGSGKTLIAILLIKELVLRERQLEKLDSAGEAIRSMMSAKVGEICGEMGHGTSELEEWTRIITENDVVVITAQVFLDCLRHARFGLEQEKYFKNKDEGKPVPKIFGMTASPINQNGNGVELTKKLEIALDSNIFTIADWTELRKYVKQPQEILELYQAPPLYSSELITELRIMLKEHPLLKALNGPIYLLDNLGPWIAERSIKEFLEEHAEKSMKISIMKAKCREVTRFEDVNSSILKKVNDHIQDHFTNLVCNYMTEDSVSDKVLRLVNILKDFSDDVCAIVFVERRCTAIGLKILIDEHLELKHIKSEVLLGTNTGCYMSTETGYKNQMKLINKFKTGEYNLLISTSVAEEGLDIQSCNVVIRFDIFKNLISYVQSRGRARDSNSKYYVFDEYGKDVNRALLEKTKGIEKQILDWCKTLNPDRVFDYSSERSKMEDLIYYEVPTTNALLTMNSAVSLLYHYCAKLPQDIYSDMQPLFEYSEVGEYFISQITLPNNCPIRLVVGDTQSSKLVAKQSAAFNACLKLKELDSFDAYFIPTNYNITPEQLVNKSEGTWKAVNTYDMKIPDAWSVPLLDGESMNRFHVSLIQMSRNDNTASFFFLSKIRIEIEDFNLIKYSENIFIKVTYYCYHEEAFQEVKETIRYNEFVFNCLTGKELDLSSVSYLILPIAEIYEKSSNGFYKSIDFDQVNYTLKSFDLTELKDSDIIIENIFRRKLYKFVNICEDYNLDSSYPNKKITFIEYFESKEKLVDIEDIILLGHHLKFHFDYLQPYNINDTENIKKPAYLLKQMCLLSSIDYVAFEFLAFFPSIIQSMSSQLLIQELNKQIQLPTIPTQLLIQGLTLSSCNNTVNYQRLEFLGDSYLKYIVSAYMFCKYKLFHEGQLHAHRTQIISNHSLSRKNKALKLYSYINSIKPHRRDWRPYNSTLKNIEDQTIASFTHELADKPLADIVESLIGAAVLTDYQTALMVCNKVGVLPESIINIESMLELSYFDRPFLEIEFLYLEEVQSILGYEFQTPALLVEALTHSTYSSSITQCYQRLEYLGDAVLDFFITEYLYHAYPMMEPGKLTEFKGACCNNGILAIICVQLGLDKFIFHNSISLIVGIQQLKFQIQQPGLKEQYWSEWNPPKVLADIIESLLGAIYVDSKLDLEAVKVVFDNLILPFYKGNISPDHIVSHPITKLLETSLKYGCNQLKHMYSLFIDRFRKVLLDADKETKFSVFLHDVEIATFVDNSLKLAKRKACQLALDIIEESLIELCSCLRC